jgi:cob(I)alamin adenosyltransferase
MPASAPLNPGLIHVYTGDGKGKTTAALGLGLRAAGHGYRVFLLQLMKGDPEYGELLSLPHVPNFDFEQSGLPTFVTMGDPSDEDIAIAKAGLERARELLEAGEHDVVILDEIICTVDYGVIPLPDVLSLLDLKPPHVELVLTGRRAPQEIIDRADLVTEMKEIKHPFREGLLARKGIDH